MADVREMRIFQADQIEVQKEVPRMLIDYSKEVIRKSPEDIIKFSRIYFETLLKNEGFFNKKQDNIKHDLHVNKVDLQDDYKTLAQIGDETYSKVRNVIHKKTGTQRVVRIIKKEDLYNVNTFDKLFPVFKSLDHPNLNKIIDCYDDNINFYFVSDYVRGGDLFTALSKRKGNFTEKDAAHVIKQLLSAVHYLHQKSIIHKNLQPENILVADDPEKLTIKLVDYEAADRKPTSAIQQYTYSPSYYIPPETLIDVGDLSDKGDLWSIGALLYTILCGEPPFYAETEEERVKKIKEGKFEMEGPVWFDISDAAKDFIKKLLSVELIDRFHAEGALKHPWIMKPSDNTVISLEKLGVFNAKEKCKQALIGYFASSTSAAKQHDDFVKHFTQLDKSKHGYLYLPEFMNIYKALKGYNYDEEELNAIIAQIDHDKQGVIDYTEFAKAEANRFKFLYLESLEMTYGQYDRGGDKVKNSVKEVKELIGLWRTAEPEKVKKFDKKIEQLGDEGEHLSSLIKAIIRKILA